MANPKIIDLLQRDLDQELTETEQEYLDFYLSKSPEDAAMASRLQQLTFELSNLPQVTSVLPLTEIVLEQMEEEERQQQRALRLKQWKLTSIVVAIALIFVTAVIAFVPVEAASLSMKKLYNPHPYTWSVMKGGLLSPDEDLVAIWEKNKIQVFDLKGNEAIPKQSMGMVRDPKMVWINNSMLSVQFTDSVGGRVTVEFPVATSAEKR